MFCLILNSRTEEKINEREENDRIRRENREERIREREKL
jgi:hypothetical protein